MEIETKTKSKKIDGIDILLIVAMLLPFCGCMLLKILTTAATEGISVDGPQIYLELALFEPKFLHLIITESQVISWAVVLTLFFFTLFLTRNLRVREISTRQVIAEFIVNAVDNLVHTNMGEFFMGFAPFITAILGLSAFSSLASLLGLFPATADINVIAGWGITVFILITHFKLKGGVWNYVKGYFEPIPVFAPLNLLGEVATPVSMSFRHYGNVLSGVCISALITAALTGLSRTLLGFIPDTVLNWLPPFLRIGVPAVLSIYFDIFSGCLQAFIFSMLTMLNISTGFPADQYEERQAKKAAKKQAKNA